MGKGEVRTLDIALLREHHLRSAQVGLMARVLKGSHSFYLHTHTFNPQSE